MKKYIGFTMAACIGLCSLSACADKAVSTASSEDKLQIVTTIFPEYDWVKEILGDQNEYAEVTLLLDNGVDLHSYQPTAEDILKVSSCDLFIYVGGESDDWVEDALKESVNPDMKVIDLLDVLGESVKEEEVIEGMEAEEEDDEEIEYDEHVWLSLKNAQILCDAIKDALCELDPDHIEMYQKNTDTYNQKLEDLSDQYQNTADEADIKTLLFGDRFPFRYLVDDYDLNYYAAFVGCSAETEASFETIAFLAQKVDELGLSTILTIENSDQKIAETIIENTTTKDQKILALDSMQSTTYEDVTKGVTYLSVMEDNLSVLKEALH